MSYCKYCGESIPTNDMAEDHAGKCPVMCGGAAYDYSCVNEELEEGTLKFYPWAGVKAWKMKRPSKEEWEEALKSFSEKIRDQKDMPAEYTKLVRENLWGLV